MTEKKISLTERALDYHRYPQPGKIATQLTKPANSQDDLSLAYSPGVASPCLEIEKNPRAVYDYTGKGNLVAVITNGTAVLGLGNIGPAASKPVMEGKAMLFKKFAGIDAFDIEINASSPEMFIETVANISPTFGAINLEDIRAPECFVIEHRLRRRLDIPVMHDDQHGTAAVTCAALRNALELQNKKPDNIRILVLGAGAAAIAITRMAIGFFKLKKRQILMFDSKGILSTNRSHKIEAHKMSFVRDTSIQTLEDAIQVSDVIIGVSGGDVIKPHMIKKMRKNPIIMAMANPIPEIMPAIAKQMRPDVIIATGRSDLPNQVNNSLCFPYLFRAALDSRTNRFSLPMYIACIKALSDLAKEPLSEELAAELNINPLHTEFGPNYILPFQIDTRLRQRIVPAIIKAINDEGDAGIIQTHEDIDSHYE